MGMRTEIQAEMAVAFDDDLADAVTSFTCERIIKSNWNPVTETYTESRTSYLGRGVQSKYLNDSVKPIDYQATDVKFLALQNEVTDIPLINDELVIDGHVFRVIDVSKDPANATWKLQLREV